MKSLEWMAWTAPTAIFFVIVIAAIVLNTVLDVRRPIPDRKGFLPLVTDRGDRLYIGLIGCAIIFLIWVAATNATLLGGLGISLVWLLLVLRWG